MTLFQWSGIFLGFYAALMLSIGLYAHKKIRDSDDFATARGAYGPFFLALAYAATTASGATFLGIPALSYQWGLASQWYGFLYPLGVYIGVLISMRLVATAGNRFGNRSIPEYLGDRYQSNGIRVLVSLMSLVLFFYLTGQLVSGIVMFQLMLGFDEIWALIFTTLVLLFYVVLGGAHADIITDGIQGAMMLVIAIVVILVTFFGVGIEGGFSGVLSNLSAQDRNLTRVLNTESSLFNSWWSIFVIIFAHVPLGLLPHLGNKLWALKSDRNRMNFVCLAAIFGLTLGMMGLGGLLARAHFGSELFGEGMNLNQALPLLFIELFPIWLAALIGVGILAAVMSTADGLVISSSQVIANDLYRRTIAPRLQCHLTPNQLDKRVLMISRFSTVGVLLVCMVLAWFLMEKNIALIVFIGIGGMMAAFAGPLILGALWGGVTTAGAYAGLIAGMTTFIVLHAQLIDPNWFENNSVLHGASLWLYNEGPNPFSCTFVGEIVSIGMTVFVSNFSEKLPESHVQTLFSDS
ncbi:MAG: sodium:pantothenate symporter [Porticoccaceae bacterium]|nr:sodium:pantothenate symporter [Porticoccaceae bacterium]